MVTKVILARHGETFANRQNTIAGHTDSKLTELGHEQARQTAEFLASEPICAVYSSDLSRALDTARPHAELHGLTVHVDAALRELNCGEWEGVPSVELVKRDYERYVTGFRENFFLCSVPGGEEISACGKRFYSAVERIARANEGQTVLIVSHGAAIRIFWAMICDIPMDLASDKIPFPSNSSYCVAEFDGERFSPVEFSHDSHLTTVTKVCL